MDQNPAMRQVAVSVLRTFGIDPDCPRIEAPATPSVGAVAEINLASKPASIMPCSMAWGRITQTREAHHAAIEAAREARRETRRQENARRSSLACVADSDMPDCPPFLARQKTAGVGVA